MLEGSRTTHVVYMIEQEENARERERDREREREERSREGRISQPMIEIDLSHVNNWIAVTLYDDSSLA